MTYNKGGTVNNVSITGQHGKNKFKSNFNPKFSDCPGLTEGNGDLFPAGMTQDIGTQ